MRPDDKKAGRIGPAVERSDSSERTGIGSALPSTPSPALRSSGQRDRLLRRGTKRDGRAGTSLLDVCRRPRLAALVPGGPPQAPNRARPRIGRVLSKLLGIGLHFGETYATGDSIRLTAPDRCRSTSQYRVGMGVPSSRSGELRMTIGIPSLALTATSNRPLGSRPSKRATACQSCASRSDRSPTSTTTF